MLWPEHLCGVGYSMRTMMITMMTARCDLDGIDGSGRQSAPVHKGTHPMQNITACIMHTLVYMQMHVCVCGSVHVVSPQSQSSKHPHRRNAEN